MFHLPVIALVAYTSIFPVKAIVAYTSNVPQNDDFLVEPSLDLVIMQDSCFYKWRGPSCGPYCMRDPMIWSPYEVPAIFWKLSKCGPVSRMKQ